jgi:AcrR family transcriptional regulator
VVSEIGFTMGQRAAGVEETRARLLKASGELFRRQGYQATTTKEIAAAARVSEPTIFRQFGSKADLFESSIIAPFGDFVRGWTRSWIDPPTETSLEALASTLVEGLYTLVRRDIAIFRELIGARSDTTSDLHHVAVRVSGEFRNGFASVHDVGLEISRTKGIVEVDHPAVIGAAASMVIGSVMLGDWVFPGNHRIPGKDRMIKEMARLIVDGVAHRG